MASPIIIRAELADADIQRAAAQTERVFKSAIDNINRSIKGLGDTLAGVGRNLPSGLGGGRGGGGGNARSAESEALRLAQAQARLQATSKDTAGAINSLNTAIDQSTAKERVLIGAKTQLAALMNRQEAETRKLEKARLAEAAATQRSANADLQKAQAQARIQQLQGNTVGAIRTLQTALDGSTASINRQLTAQTQLQRLQNINTAGWRRYASTIREAGESIQQAGYALTGFTLGALNLGRSAIQSAINIDKQVNSLRALTGSAEAAEARFKALFDLAQRTPGLTTNLALTLDAQLRAANVSQNNIDRVLPAIGRINAVSPLGDPQKFAQNLLQLVTQGFERTDLKELVGQSPIAGRIISELFNVENPTNAKAIRESAQRLGLTSADAFFKAFGDTAAQSPALANVTESLGTQIEKLQDRLSVALRPLGLRLLQTILPVVERIVPVIERALLRFGELPAAAQTAIIGFVGLAAAIGPATIALGGLIQTVGAIGNLVTVVTALGGAGATAAGVAGTGGGIAAIAAALTPLLPLIGAVAIAVGGLAAAWYTDFGGIREATANAFDEISKQFDRLGPLRDTTSRELNTIRSEFQLWSDLSRPIVKGLFDYLSDYATQKLAETQLQIAFFSAAFRTALQSLRQQFSLSATIGGLGIGLVTSPKDALKIGGAAAAAFGNLDRNRAQGTGQGLDGEEVTADQMFNSGRGVIQPSRAARIAGAGGGGGGRSGAGARSAAIREAETLVREQNRLEVERVRAVFELQKDANTRAIEADQESYRLRLISADEFYRNKQGLLEANIGNEINLLNTQLVQAQAAFDKAKPQSPERLTAERDVLQLRTQIEIKTRELGEVEREINKERTRNIGKDKDNLAEQLSITEERRAVEEKILRTITERVSLEERAVADEKERLQQQLDRVRGDAAAVGANLGLKQQLALEDAILRVRQADEDAYLSMIQNRVKLADAGILNSNRANAIFLDHLAQQQSVTEATGDAMIRVYEGVASSLDRGIDKLTKRLGVFGEAISGIFKAITRNLISRVFGGGQQGQQGGSAIGSLFGGLFGGGGQQSGGGFGGIFGGGGGGFLTPGFNPNAGGGGLGSLLGGGGLGGLFGGAATPASVSLGGLPLGRSFPVGLSAQPGGVATGGGGFGGLLGSLGLGSAFKGLGFGKAAGSGGALAAALPFLGVNLGIGLGGSSGLGKVIGGIGGGLLGVGLSAAPAIFGAGGALASPAIAALFSNPFTAIAGAGLLVGAFFLGKAKQRRKDEQASGNYLQDAIDSIRDLRSGIARDEIDGKDARSIFNKQILETFKQQISTLKTKSVRESRLTNQVNDLKKLYADEVVPEIEKQRTRKQIFGKLTPEFATGGIMPRDGFAYLHKDEIIVNRSQQSPQLLRAASQAGVPGVNSTIAAGPGSGGPIVVNLAVEVGMSKSGAEEIVIAGMETEAGQNIVVNLVHAGQRDRQLRKR